ncbi:unnamed protein product [Prunus brigantina]
MLLIPTGKNGIWRPFNVMDDRLGKERTWIYADGRHTLIEEVVFVEDKCYAVDNWSRLLSLMLLLALTQM